MKGTLQYLSKDETLVKNWTVWYNEQPIGGNITFVDGLPLHPDDIKEIEESALVFDNVEARYHNQDVEFEIVDVWKNKGIGTTVLRYAKLVNTLNKDRVEDMIRHSDEVWSGTIPELSDEEIEKQSELIELGIHKMFFKTGAKWYREQLKQRK